MRRFCRRGVGFAALALLLVVVLAGVSWESERFQRPDLANFVNSQVLVAGARLSELANQLGPQDADASTSEKFRPVTSAPVPVAANTAAPAPGPAPAPASTTPGPTAAATTEAPPSSVSLFCFAWTPRRKFDEELLKEVRLQFAKCDGHLFFTDTGSPGPEEPDFVRVELPAQKVTRDQGGWLYHRNMVGLMPALSYLLGSQLLEQYQWFINAELDHFLSPARARSTITAYAQRVDKAEERSMMLMWGNAFVFNRQLLQDMRKHWDKLGLTASLNGSKDEATAVGCPMFMKGKSEWPGSCSQDIIFPALAWDVLPKITKRAVVTLGDPGCGHPAKYRNKELPLGCWEMQQNPLGGESLQGELSAIRVLADMTNLDKVAVETYCAHAKEAVQKNCKKFYDGRHVPIIHHVNNIAIHALARQLLDESSVPGVAAGATEASAGDPSTTAQPVVSATALTVPRTVPGPTTVPPMVPTTAVATTVSTTTVPTTTAPTATVPATAISAVPAAAMKSKKGSGNLTLFCFAWSPRRKNDEGVLNEVRRQFNKCDGHLFFTDTESPQKSDEDDFVRIAVPTQRLPRTHGQWLYHRNMVGLMPSWDYLLRSQVAEQYDWLLNSELDHFLSPSRAKENILAYLRGMEEGNREDKAALDGPIMLMWGNAFVFNRKFVQALKEHWPLLGQVASMDNRTSKDGRAVGCPMFMKGRSEWPDSCSQDMIYPALAMNVLPPLKVKAHFPGASGCGQPSKNRKNREYPLGCWEMQQNPLRGESEAGELAAIKELAQMSKFKDRTEAKAYCANHESEAMQKNCMKFWDGRNVPLIHHIHTVSEHALARSILDHDPD